MENKKTNKIEITINGKSFEVPVDMSVLTGFMQAMPQLDKGSEPLNSVRRSLGLPIVQQSSHRRLEDEFFGAIHEDMDSFRRFGVFGRDERNSRALIALHRRIRRIEELLNSGCCEEEPAKKVVKKKKPESKPKKSRKK